jgi:hypothetical protein
MWCFGFPWCFYIGGFLYPLTPKLGVIANIMPIKFNNVAKTILRVPIGAIKQTFVIDKTIELNFWYFGWVVSTFVIK